MTEKLVREDQRLAAHVLHHAPRFRERVEQLLEQAAAARAAGENASLKQLLVQQRILSAGDLVVLLLQLHAGAEPEACDPPYSLIETQAAQSEARPASLTDQLSAHGELQYYGRYEALEEIARGGMGIVYRARDAQTGEIVALKVLKSGDQASENEIDRFQREVDATRQLDHPHVVRIHGHGEDRGRYFYAMDFVEGTALDALHLQDDFSQQQAAEILLKVARALQAAHALGIVHRDLKPANILIDREGQPRLTDFGLAKLLSGSVLTLTRSGMTLGTPYYMAPEQVDEKGVIDARTDIYALGVVLYQCLTRKLPFVGTQANLFYKILETEAEPPRKLDPLLDIDLETICLKAMARSPGQRYASMEALGDDLSRYLSGKTITARRATLLMRLSQQAHRQRKTILGALLTGVLLTPLVIWLLQRQARATRQAAELELLRVELDNDRLRSRIQEVLTRAGAQREAPLALAILAELDPLYRSLGQDMPGPIAALRQVWRAEVSIEKGDYRPARAQLTDATRRDPESHTAQRRLAFVLLKLNLPELSAVALAGAQRLERQQADRLAARSRAALAAGRGNEALALVTRAIALPESGGAAPHHMLRGRIYLSRGLAERALTDFELAGRGGEDPETVLIARVRALLRLGRLARARRDLLRYTKRHPTPDALAALGDTEHALGRHEQALAVCARAGALLGQLRALIELGRLEQAAIVAARLWQTDRIDAAARYYKGRLMQLKGLAAPARRLLLEAASAPDWRDRARIALARIDLGAGQPGQALARLDGVTGCGAERLTLLGQIQLALGRHADAAATFGRSIERYPYDASPFLLRGRARNALDQTDAAHADFIQAYGLDNLDFTVFEQILRNVMSSGRIEMLPQLNAVIQQFSFEPDPDDLPSIFGQELRILLQSKTALDRGEAAPPTPPSRATLTRALIQFSSSDPLERALGRSALLSGKGLALEQIQAAPSTPALRRLARELTRTIAIARRRRVEDLLMRYAAGRHASAGRRLHDQTQQLAPLLREILTDSKSSVLIRIWAGQALARPRQPKMIEALRGLAREEDAESGLLAGWVLRKMKIAAPLPARLALARGNDSLKALALISLTPAEARSVAAPLLTHIAPRVRYAAAVALLRAGDRRGLPPLATLQADPDPLLRRLGILGLAARRSAEDWPLQEFYLRALRDSDPRVRALGARVIRQLGDGRAAELLLEALKREQHPLVRSQLTVGVIGISTPETQRYVARLLDDGKQSPVVRTTALYALIRWMRGGDFAAVPDWKRLATLEPDPILRCASLYGISEFLPLIAPYYLRISFEAEHPTIRGLAAMCLVLLPHVDAADKRTLLSLALHDPAEVTRRTAWVSVGLLAHAGRLERPGIWQEIRRLPQRQQRAVAEGLAQIEQLDQLQPPKGVPVAEFQTAALERACSLWPENARYRSLLADMWMRQGKIGKAGEVLAQARTQGRWQARGLRTLAQYAALQQRWTEAIALEQRSVARWLENPFPVPRGVKNPVHPLAALLRAADHASKKGDQKAAIRMLRRASYFQLREQVVFEPFWLLARAQARLGKLSELVQTLAEVIQLGAARNRVRGELAHPAYAAVRDGQEIHKLLAEGR